MPASLKPLMTISVFLKMMSSAPISQLANPLGLQCVNFYMWNGSSTGYLLLNLFCVPGLEALLHLILQRLVNRNVKRLQLVSTISRRINMINIVLLKKLMNCMGLLAPEDIKLLDMYDSLQGP